FTLAKKYLWIADTLRNKRDKYFLVSDSRDVIFMDTLDNIFKKFQSTKCKFLMQGETFPYYKDREACRFEDKHRYQYVCSGLCIGERKYFLDVIMPLYEKYANADIPVLSENDQLIMEEIYLRHNDGNFKLDHRCNLFQEMACHKNGTSCNFDLNFNFKTRKIKNTHTNVYPSIFHGAGNTILSQVEKILKLKQQQHQSKFLK
ncbi:MAG: glycosyltransferase domain-containing protein, partial [Candidatus Ranarchaeia archaeon]